MIQKEIFSTDASLVVSKKQTGSLYLFWYGIAIYTIFYTLSTTNNIYISAALCQGIQIIGFLLIIAGAATLIKFKFDNQYLQLVFTLFLLYSISIVLRGSSYDFNSLKIMFLEAGSGAMPYLVPIVALLPRKIGAYKNIFQVLLILGVTFIICVILFYNILHDPDRLNQLSLGLVENFSGLLAIPVGFVLLTYFYHSQKKDFLDLGWKNIFAGVVLLVALFFAIYRARRGLIFICGTTIAAILMIYFISTKKKALVITLLIVFLAAVTLFMAGRKTPAIFNFLIDRGEEDTRTGVEEYMYADMSSTDWIIGKGINGEYYCPIVDNVNDPSGYRQNIETGYLQMILKGGIVNVALLLLILVPAAFKGIFKSKNILSKAAGMWILLWIIYEYPIIGVGFSMHYILVWISVGICYSKKISKLSDNTIKYYLQN